MLPLYLVRVSFYLILILQGIFTNETAQLQEELDIIIEELNQSEKQVFELVQSKMEIAKQIELLVQKFIFVTSQM